MEGNEAHAGYPCSSFYWEISFLLYVLLAVVCARNVELASENFKAEQGSLVM